MALDLRNKVFEYLKENPEKKFTARQIAQWIFDKYPEACHAKKSSSTFITNDAELIQQLVAEISSQRPHLQKKHPEIKTAGIRPRHYYYSEKSDSDEVEDAEAAGTKLSEDAPARKLTEHDLYPILSAYLRDEFGIFSKRIDEKRSSNRRGPHGNRWLYPDLVGMEDLGAEWNPVVRECVQQYSDKRTKLWSFEVKLLVNRSNVRECFFQSVSNSSWANFGYLVSAQIGGSDTLKELRILCAAQGIGLIQLDPENPAESQIVIPARERPEIDWDSANRLAMENRDFLEYVKLVKQFYQTGEVRPRDWDLPSKKT
jgi:hypothetical protein